MADKPCTHSELTARVAAIETGLSALKENNILVARVVALEAELTAFKELMEERDKRYEQRSTSQDNMSAAAMASAKEAVMTAKSEVDAHLKALNEIRNMSLDQARTFAVQKVMDEKFDGVKTEFTNLKENTIERKGISGGMKEMLGYFLAAGAVVGAVIVELIRH